MFDLDYTLLNYTISRYEEGKLLMTSLNTKIYRAKKGGDYNKYMTLCQVKNYLSFTHQ